MIGRKIRKSLRNLNLHCCGTSWASALQIRWFSSSDRLVSSWLSLPIFEAWGHRPCTCLKYDSLLSGTCSRWGSFRWRILSIVRSCLKSWARTVSSIIAFYQCAIQVLWSCLMLLSATRTLLLSRFLGTIFTETVILYHLRIYYVSWWTKSSIFRFLYPLLLSISSAPLFPCCELPLFL